jgi:hypothetical protein
MKYKIKIIKIIHLFTLLSNNRIVYLTSGNNYKFYLHRQVIISAKNHYGYKYKYIK